MDCAHDARALGLIGAFLNVREHNSVPCFYSCKVSRRACSNILFPFNVSLSRRGNDWGPYEAFFVKSAVNLLEAIRILVACPTLSQFSFGDMGYREIYRVPSRSENLLSEVFTLLRSSPSLSCFHFITSEIAHNARLYFRDLQALVCENPRLETLTVSASGNAFAVVAKAIAVCLSRNTVLKSFTLRIPTLFFHQVEQSLEILLRPFTSSSPSEANASLKELALYLQYPDGYNCLDAIANLVSHNTTLKKLDLCFPSLNLYSSRGLRPLVSALQSNTTLKHVQCIYGLDGYGNYTRDDAKYITDKISWHLEFQIQEILRTMIDNELRVNTSLESFVVGHWTLLRVGTEWQTSYRGPCLREQKEYNVKVKMAP
ncbi:hypothetical protein KC19_2G227100 [Ceratodon purpureus]|uniref:Uncharacterized protein n=1 Tax=Ceratodon purpureus TaxID=3225 RepID=A0A8T0IZR9_CERPU|nr:hypothetical protein KC19_2G227100 [Ceratodon purpureus]